MDEHPSPRLLDNIPPVFGLFWTYERSTSFSPVFPMILPLYSAGSENLLYIAVHLPKERRVTIIIMNCDFEVIYSLGLLGAATVVNPSECIDSYVSWGIAFRWGWRWRWWWEEWFRVGLLTFTTYLIYSNVNQTKKQPCKFYQPTSRQAGRSQDQRQRHSLPRNSKVSGWYNEHFAGQLCLKERRWKGTGMERASHTWEQCALHQERLLSQNDVLLV